MKGHTVPRSFLWRRLHSLMGLGLVLFLFEHLLTNSEAALPVGHDGAGFVRMVNLIHSLPYLQVIEISLIGLPLLVHTIWGIKYLLTSAPNNSSSDGSTPSLSDYPRNKFYTLQRLTSWILLVGIALHVFQMRFDRYPAEASREGTEYHMVKVSMDAGLYTLQQRMGFDLYDASRIRSVEQRLGSRHAVDMPARGAVSFVSGSEPIEYDGNMASKLQQNQRHKMEVEWLETLKHKSLEKGEVIAVAPSAGAAILLTVRDTMKSPMMCVLYTILLLAGVYHAFNGLWTFLVTWGLTMTVRSQQLSRYLTVGLMGLMMFLGLASIWGTYWINLYS